MSSNPADADFEEQPPPSRKRRKTNDHEESQAYVRRSLNDLQITPKNGRLHFLKTKAEVRAGNETVEVYISKIPTKSASAVLSHIKKNSLVIEGSTLQHLRRFIREEYLPAHLREDEKPEANEEHEQLPYLDSETGKPEALQPGLISDTTSHSYLFICPTTSISLSDLTTLLSTCGPFADSNNPPKIWIIPVPLHAPTSAEQAALWSKDYWPISYKNTNPYGPHPTIVKRAEADLAPHAGFYLSLAEKAAKEASEARIGERAGCVIVENTSGMREVVAVAGDARWCGLRGGKDVGPGNVTAHAVMRAIGMVAKKRLRMAAVQQTEIETINTDLSAQNSAVRNLEEHLHTDYIFLDRPLTDLETQVFSEENIAPNGYLCVDLDIYVTHEPCVMCSMAILHSRFGRCVFGKRMLLTGAMTADTRELDLMQGKEGLGHGLFWRPSELNWKFLCWEFEGNDGSDTAVEIEDTVQV